MKIMLNVDKKTVDKLVSILKFKKKFVQNFERS